MTAETGSQPGNLGRLIVSVIAVAFYSYPFWTALGNLVNVPAYYSDQFGVTADTVPWVLLFAGVATPILVFATAVVFAWRRGAGALALLFTAGFAVINAISLSILAFEKEVELRIVIDFLTGS
jgi:hypothetical protein